MNSPTTAQTPLAAQGPQDEADTAELVRLVRELVEALEEFERERQQVRNLVQRVKDFLADTQDMFPDEGLFSDNDGEAFESLVKLRAVLAMLEQPSRE